MGSSLVRKAREEEMQYKKKHAVYEKVLMSQCWKETGKIPVKTGWADTKGTSECPKMRSRWVAKEYNTGPRPELFSATSPLEGDGEDPSQDRLGGHEQGNVRVSEHEISMGREGIQHRTEARVVQRNITSGGSAACHLGGSVKQQGTVLLVTDVRRAHFHANARRRVYIELPEGDGGGSGSRQWAAEKELGRHP